MGILLHGKPTYSKRTVSFKGKKFTVEIADSFNKIATGLMNHTGLGHDEGMLFIFNRDGRYGFWMLHMKFSIDIIWLDSGGRVVHVWKNAEPCRSFFSCRTVKPEGNSRYVIELNAGTAKKLGMKVGDRFKL